MASLTMQFPAVTTASQDIKQPWGGMINRSPGTKSAAGIVSGSSAKRLNETKLLV